MIFPPLLSLSLSLSLNSEEAKSTTWLHPISGEAVITGHRKTPGKVSPRCRQVFFLCRCLTAALVRRHVQLFVSPPSPKTDVSHSGREAVTPVPRFITHEWAFVARAVKKCKTPSCPPLRPARATSP